MILIQVSEINDRELVEMLMPGCPKPYSGLNLKEQKSRFEAAGFTILESGETFRPIKFYDVEGLIHRYLIIARKNLLTSS